MQILISLTAIARLIVKLMSTVKLTRPNVLIVLLEYIDSFQSKWKHETIMGCPILYYSIPYLQYFSRAEGLHVIHQRGLYLICKQDAPGCSSREEHLQRYKPNGCVTTALYQ